MASAARIGAEWCAAPAGAGRESSVLAPRRLAERARPAARRVAARVPSRFATLRWWVSLFGLRP